MLSDQNVGGSSRRDFPDLLWRLASSPALRLVLVALLALSLVAGSLLPQLPDETAGGPAAAANRWLSTSSARYGTWGPFLRALGLFDVASAVWFRLLLALLAFHLLLAAADAASAAWLLLVRRRRPMPSRSGGTQWTTVSLLPPLQQAADTLCSRLRADGLGVLREEHNESATGACLYADRARFGLLGPLLWSAGGLILLLGLFINNAWGWRTGEILLAPDEETSLGYDTGLSLRRGMSSTPGSRAQLLVRDSLDQVVALPLGPAQPARHGAIWLHHLADGPALVVEARDGESRPVSVQSHAGAASTSQRAYLVFDQPQAERHVTVPELSLALRIVAQSGPAAEQTEEGFFVVQGYEAGSSHPVIEASVGDGPAILSLGEGSILLTPERYSVLRAAYTPGLRWLFLGGLLVLVASASPVLWPTVQVWVQLIPERRAVSAELVVRALGASWGAEQE